MVRILGSLNTLIMYVMCLLTLDNRHGLLKIEFQFLHMARHVKKASSKLLSKFNRNPPSLDTPLPYPPPKDVPTKILAFRTMTKMLSIMQQEQIFKVAWVDSDVDTQELVLSTAFATISVIEKEVVAVATKRSYGKLEVICSPEIPPKSPPPWWFMSFFVTKNFRRDDPRPIDPETGEVIIGHVVDAGKVPDYDLEDDPILHTWLEERW